MIANKYYEKQDTKVYNAALYVRLSREDEDKNKQVSESIINQEEFLRKYATDNGFNIIDTYADDGISRYYIWQRSF